MKSFQKVLNVLEKVISVIMVFLFVVMTVSMTAQIIARYVFRHGLSWSDEILRYACIYMVMLGAAVLMGKKDDHINLNILDNMVSPKVLHYINIVRAFLSLVFSAMVCWYSKSTVSVGLSSKSSSGIPMYMIYAVLPISFGIMTIYAFFLLIEILREKPETKEVVK